MARTPRVSARARKILLANPSVVFLSDTLKPKVVKRKPTRTLAIRVYVEKKLPRSKIPAGQLLPKKIGKIPTDVQEIGKIEPLAAVPANRERLRPVLGGASGIVTAAPAEAAGTIGYFVRDTTAAKPPNKPQWYALSCAHVLNPGLGSTQTETLQPSPLDGGSAPGDWIGNLYLSTFTKADAAIAKIDIGARAQIIGLPAPKGIGKGQIDLVVAKSGRTTAVTYGTITDEGEFQRKRFLGKLQVDVTFEKCFLIESRKGSTFAAAGDSGSLVIDPVKKEAIALLFAGKAEGPFIASDISVVMAAFPNQMLVLPGESYP